MAESRDLQHHEPEDPQLRFTVQEVRRGSKWLICAQLVVAVATAALVITSAVTAWLTYKQIVAVRASLEESQRQFNQSQRPWVGVVHFQITNVEVGKKPHAVVRTANKGATPARVKTRLYIKIQPEMPQRFSYLDLPRQSAVILLPDTWADASFDFPQELSEEIMAVIDGGKVVLYAYGFAEYEDSRGNTYRTNFCAFWDPQKRSQVFCLTHNTVE